MFQNAVIINNHILCGFRFVLLVKALTSEHLIFILSFGTTYYISLVRSSRATPPPRFHNLKTKISFGFTYIYLLKQALGEGIGPNVTLHVVGR